MKSIPYKDLGTGQIRLLVSRKASFTVTGLGGGKMTEAVELVEREIESQNMRCRIYTKGRIAAAGATVFGGVTGMLGAASAVGMAAHNLATFNPDYEIAKHKVDNKLTVEFKK